uniref:Uncharacterized protein n=1 Tax=Anguilla anguilla TaxID=7936 RepID=A0A0E9TGD0_ANGAN
MGSRQICWARQHQFVSQSFFSFCRMKGRSPPPHCHFQSGLVSLRCQLVKTEWVTAVVC